MRALHVVFGAGPLGRALAQAIPTRGHRVRWVDLRGVPLEAPLGIEVWRGDPHDPAWIQASCADASVVYDACDERGRQGARVRRAFEAGVTAADARVVSLERVPGVPTEDPHEQLDPRRVVGRCGDVFGGGWEEGPLDVEALRQLRRHTRIPFPGNPDLPHTWWYLPDVARALITLGESDSTGGRSYNLPAAPALTTRELLRLGCVACGHPERMPALKITRAAPGFDQPQRAEHQVFLEAFGPEAARVTPLAKAIGDALAEAG